MKSSKTFTITSSIIGVFSWFVFFGLGLFIDSSPFRHDLQHFQWNSFIMSLITYTPTNIAFLCIAAAFCGGCSSNLGIVSKLKEDTAESIGNSNTNASQNLIQQNPFNCLIRGFVVYIAFIGGMYVVADSPFTSTSPDQYARAAGGLSLLAYLVGYDQSNFVNLINLSSKLKKES